MYDEMTAILEALIQLQNAKTFEEMGQVAQRWWGTLRSPAVAVMVDQMVKDSQKKFVKGKESYPDELAEMLRIQRFLQHALRQNIPYAVAEEYRLQKAIFDAFREIFGATPAIIRQKFAPYQSLLANPTGIAWAKTLDRANTQSEIDEGMEEYARNGRHERRLLIVQFLEDVYRHDVNYAEKRFKQAFEAWLHRVNDELRRRGIDI